MTDLGTLGGTSASANGINAEGQVVGGASTVDDNAYHAFLYSGGTMVDLGTLGWNLSEAEAINEAGQVVGYSFVGQLISTRFCTPEGS